MNRLLSVPLLLALVACSGGGGGKAGDLPGDPATPDAVVTDPGAVDPGPATDPGSQADLPVPKGLIKPSDLQYLGAFRLPAEGGAEPADSWDWAGQAITFYPGGDPAGPADGFPGSLFATGLDTDCRVSEVAIPVPKVSKNLAELGEATPLQGFHDIRSGLFGTLTELPRVALQYLPKQGGQASGKP